MISKKQLKAIRRRKNINRRHNIRTNNVPKHLRAIPSAINSYMN